MSKKRVFYCELAYVFGIIILAFGTSLMEKASFGLSMIVAPAYILHLKISEFLPFFSFGMAEYVFQALLLCFISLVMKKVKKSYFLSFATAVLYGFLLDIFISLLSFFPFAGIGWRIAFYVLGLLICTMGVALLFHTYLPPEAYEVVVKELAGKLGKPISRVKTVYDFSSLLLGVILSLCFFGGFVGVQWGTIVSTVFNGWLIGMFSRFFESKFVFTDAFPIREKFN